MSQLTENRFLNLNRTRTVQSWKFENISGWVKRQKKNCVFDAHTCLGKKETHFFKDNSKMSVALYILMEGEMVNNNVRIFRYSY